MVGRTVQNAGVLVYVRVSLCLPLCLPLSRAFCLSLSLAPYLSVALYVARCPYLGDWTVSTVPLACQRTTDQPVAVP